MSWMSFLNCFMLLNSFASSYVINQCHMSWTLFISYFMVLDSFASSYVIEQCQMQIVTASLQFPNSIILFCYSRIAPVR